MQITKRIILTLITIYQASLSALIGQQCRFEPSCSQYTKEAITKLGILNGTRLGFKRICRCHPWCAGGYDPVLEKDQANKAQNHLH